MNAGKRSARRDAELLKQRLHLRVATLNRRYKRMIMVVADFIALPLAFWSAYALRFSEWFPGHYLSAVWWMFPIIPVVGVFVFARLGLYRAVVRYMGVQALMAVLKGVLLLSLILLASAFILRLQNFPRSIPVNFALVALLYVGGSRLLVRAYYQWIIKHYSDKQPVIIYGAGGAGAQLATALASGREFYVVAFLDDERALWGSSVLGIPVHCPDDAAALVTEYTVDRVLLALPTASRRQRKHALDVLEGLPVHVQTVPSMPEIVSGQASVDQLREVDIEDLLGRDPVPPQKELLDISIYNKVVMVTGAGGSIGSELCRQILRSGPTKLIMLELSEYGLYSIDQELKKQVVELGLTTELLPFLGSVCHQARVEAIIQRYRVQTIYHAAAYKHVPMVEHNVFEGIRNNVLGTQVVMQAAADHKVERCILVSTDKAVRPTNVMGATKRMAELVVQDLAQQGKSTVFSMVRFGNVLGSSGSVVPLFRKQIQSGGPVTVTHPDINRFFMTIPEAALLVIQAGSMAQGGDVFVLDMGKPVKIVDLARRMIELSGLDVKSDQNPDGDIAIEFSGLRPGEKLYEELLIGEDVEGTSHPKIMRANEEVVPHETLYRYLHELQVAELRQDIDGARSVLREAVKGFVPSSELVDWLLPLTVPVSKSSVSAVLAEDKPIH
ncbi:polysaccharide biosynthesis protein [Salinispirillum marinum]|uniref:Polysaccharide biosynthesis protein n=1 Tax=Saccharospirillum mangrovi TaxID=2161747 RepID=A0ABV8A088_9GAMM